jgi:hypothetical protein
MQSTCSSITTLGLGRTVRRIYAVGVLVGAEECR